MRARASAALLLGAGLTLAQDAQPKRVDPGDSSRPPSDAVALFNGRDMTGWKTTDGRPAECRVEDGAMACTSGSGNIVSTETFRDAQIHLEFRVPLMADQKDQLRGNSGVYLHAKYELQILDSYENETYPTGMLGALYGQAPPLVNAARPPEQWQAYDLTFRAPRCDSTGAVTEKARLTAHLNGVLIHDNVSIEASTGCEAGPILLQDHSGFEGAPVTTMGFRNIWIRRLGEQYGAANQDR